MLCYLLVKLQSFIHRLLPDSNGPQIRRDFLRERLPLVKH